MPYSSFSVPLLQQVFSYLFHELISPLSSLVTGLDLLEEGIESDEVMIILKNAATTLRNRLELFRAALGSGGAHLSLSQVQKLLDQFWKHEKERRVSFQTDTLQLPLSVGQQILLLTLWLAHMKTSDAVSAQLSYQNGQFSVHFQNVSWDEKELFEVLAKQPETLTPKTSMQPFIHWMLSDSLTS